MKILLLFFLLAFSGCQTVKVEKGIVLSCSDIQIPPKRTPYDSNKLLKYIYLNGYNRGFGQAFKSQMCNSFPYRTPIKPTDSAKEKAYMKGLIEGYRQGKKIFYISELRK